MTSWGKGPPYAFGSNWVLIFVSNVQYYVLIKMKCFCINTIATREIACLKVSGSLITHKL